MSQQTQLSNLSTRIATEIKSLRTLINNNQIDLSALSTTDKTNLVAAINEVLATVAGGGSVDLSVTNLTATGLTIDSPSGTDADIPAATALLAGLMIAADKAKLDALPADPLARSGHTGTQTVSTISDFTAEVNVLIQDVVDAAPAALDTLNELAASLGDDPDFAATINTSLSNRLRFDAVQTLTAGEKTQGQANLEVYGQAAIGDPETNYVTIFETGLV